MDNAELDQPRQAYKDAVEPRHPDHSVHAWDLWENAGFREQDARKRVLAAKLKYEDRLRETDYGILTTDH